ncbi:ferritin-like domain-containing protein [Myxococcus sp. NMCA1]|uniref:ferritin-like domain-containing protein n=1 Tax=Myxococcus sp. NMCA1 TaxID=2996785 RepID=UPI002285DF6D|nr:ferritin-like domain-containing protein [Myxococcus sp. NMCA1]WAM25177.1 ferritin-like domain-containing protein [Myxococcus sp. NMCA1]
MQNKTWTDAALLEHLQKAVYLELWTIPLYLTAAYSLQVPGTNAQLPPQQVTVRGKKNPNRSREQLAFNNIYSVVVQEMLHLELASNLFNALFAPKGYSPKFMGEWAPRYDRFPSWIAVNKPVKLGPVDPEQMSLLAAIETPEPKSDGAPNGPQDAYDSIGQFYKAIEQGINQRWNELYQPDADHRQKSEFANPQYKSDDYTRFSSTIGGDSRTALKQANEVLQAIVGQGEGNLGPVIDSELRPEDANDLEDQFSHFARFRMVQAMLKFGGPLKTYPTTESSGLAAAQQQLTTGFTSLLTALEKGYAGDDELDLGSMWALPKQIVSVWSAGGVPQF